MRKKRKIQRFLLFVSAVLIFTILYFLFFDNKSTSVQTSSDSGQESSYVIKPYFRGVGKDTNLYEINASRAIETTEGDYDLYDVILKYYLDKKRNSYFSATSISGILDKKTNILKFIDSVDMIYSEGYRGVAENLSIDLSKRTAFTDLPFTATGVKGRIFSKRGFLYRMKNKKIFFHGPVKTLIFDQKL